MVAETVPPRSALTAAMVAQRVAKYVRDGEGPWAASRRVLQEIIDGGRADDLLTLVGASPVYDLWLSAQPRPTKVAPTPITAASPPSPRRVDTAQLQDGASLLEGLQQVSGAWVRVGDLTGTQCRIVARQLKAQALEVAQNARYYHKLGQTLGEGEKVRQRFTEADLIRLYDEAGQS